MEKADDLRLPCPGRDLADADVPRWLADAGEVFTVFARQDSGNVGFGVRLPVGRAFVKHLSSENAAAVPRLRALHDAVQHPVVVPVTQIVPTRSAALVVQPWANGEVLYGPAPKESRRPGTHGMHGKHGRPPMADRDDPSGSHARFRSREVQDIVADLLAVLDAHVAIDEAGFVAVDLYDGCLLWDDAAPPGTGVHLIDLDEYRSGPFVVDAPLSGSTRFMAPEDQVVGERVDRRSSVHALSRMIAVLLASDGSGGGFRGGPALAAVVRRGSAPDRESRFADVASLRSAVQHALDSDASG